MTWTLKDTENDATVEFSSKAKAEEKRDELTTADTKGRFKIVPPESEGSVNAQNTSKAEMEDNAPQPPKPVETDTDGYELPENPPMDTDPLSWIPSDFVDRIDDSVAINRKGYEVLAQHFDISCQPEMVVSPVETDGEYCVHKAVAENDGTLYTAYGEAYYENEGNEMVRYSDTRSYKRAIARATGVGMLAVEELRKEDRQ